MENNIKICERPILKCRYMNITDHDTRLCCFPPNEFLEHGFAKCWEGGCSHFEAETYEIDGETYPVELGGTYMPENNAIRPNHYCSDREYEPIKVIQDWKLDFALGNAIKYIARAGKKDDIVQDLKKAQQYLSFEIEFLEKQRENHANDNKILDISPDEAKKFNEFARKRINQL